jgi:CBS domain containing-hemolysin-like protein
VILIALSAFFSSAETAFMSVNRIRIKTMVDDGNKRAALISSILDNTPKMLSAILIGNNVVNIFASSLTTTLFGKIFGNAAVGIATGLLTFLILIFGEITPKTMATIHAEKLAMLYAPVIHWTMIIFTPIIIIVNALSGALIRLLGAHKNTDKVAMTENEIRTIVEESYEDGVIETSEKKMINNVFDFGDALAKDVMIPRIDITMADVNSSYDDIIQLFKENKYTRFPIYDGSTDNVVGILNIKDLFMCDTGDGFNMRDVMREPYFTYEHRHISKLFEDLRSSSNTISIVIDEYGSTVGLITLEDLVEEIVGEIRDEYDDDETDDIEKISDRQFRINGSAKLDDVNDRLGTEFESEDNDSIGGFMIEKLDRFPEKGDKLEFPDKTLLVTATTNKRVDSILLTLTAKSPV